MWTICDTHSITGPRGRPHARRRHHFLSKAFRLGAAVAITSPLACLMEVPLSHGSQGRIPQGRGFYTTIEDRREAIRLAVRSAGSEDMVLICGKGHETYLIVGEVARHFDDREERCKRCGNTHLGDAIVPGCLYLWKFADDRRGAPWLSVKGGSTGRPRQGMLSFPFFIPWLEVPR